MTTTSRVAQPEAGADAQGDRDDRLLRWTASFFAIAVVLHGLDHARRGADSLHLDVFWAGTSALTIEVGVVVLACQRHRLAPLAASVAGFLLALGYVVVHFLPARAWLSDSLTSATDVSPLSWMAEPRGARVQRVGRSGVHDPASPRRPTVRNTKPPRTAVGPR
ncbi:MAG: hypothetical protein ABIY48_06545, partial [Acidimicrobiales bacterium]